MSALIDREPPAVAEILARAGEMATAGAPLEPQRLLGLDSAELEELQQIRLNGGGQPDQSVWHPLVSTGATVMVDGNNAAIVQPSGSYWRPLGSHLAQRALSSIRMSAEGFNRPVVLIESNDPDHPIHRLLPDGWWPIFIPADPELCTEWLSFSGIRLPAMPFDDPPEPATELRFDGRTLGYYSSGSIRLRFNPFAALGGSSSWTMHRVEERRSLLEAALAALAAASPQRLSYESAWVQADALVSRLGDEIAEFQSRLKSELRDISRAEEAAERNVDDCRIQLSRAERDLQAARNRAATRQVLVAANHEQRRQWLDSLAGELDRLERMPQLQSVEIDSDLRLRVQTKPLVIDCGDQGRRLVADGIRFVIDFGKAAPTVALPILLTRGLTPAHPQQRDVGHQFDWGDAQVALIERVGTRELAAAVSICCGALAARCADAAGADHFPVAEPDARPGFQRG